MPAGSALALGTTAAVLLALFGRKKGKSVSADTDTRKPWIVPVWDPSSPNGRAIVSDSICKVAAKMASETTPGRTTILTPVLESRVWDSLWQGVPWPVLPGDHPSVLAAAAIVRELVASYMADPVAFCKGEPVEPAKPSGPVPIDLAT